MVPHAQQDRFEVRLRADAPRAVLPHEVAEARALLTARALWSSVALTLTDDRSAVLLELEIVTGDLESARRLSVEGVRTAFALDARFLRWVVDGRTAEAVPVRP
jgi:ATP/maltotriose-dependent transcriptional regulator MalT